MLSGNLTRSRIILDGSNYVEWLADIKREHAAKTTYLSEIFKGKKPTEYDIPKILDMVKLADGTLTSTKRFETVTDLSTGIVTFTSAGIKSFESANRQYTELCDKRRSVNAVVLLDLQNHISPASILKIQSQVGAAYDDIESDLALFFSATALSHQKSDPVSLMEVWVKLTRCRMSDDYFLFIHELAELKKQIQLKFANYLDSTGHVAAFLDTIFSLQLALGVSKKPEYLNVLEIFRAKDFTSPVVSGGQMNFTLMLDLFTSATVSASVMNQFEDNGLIGNSAIAKKKVPPQANSSETVGTQTKCLSCGARFPVTLHYKTRVPFDTCKACNKKKFQDKKALEEKAKATGAAKRAASIPAKPVIPLRSATSSASSATVMLPSDSAEFLDSYASEDEDSQ